MSPSFAAAWTHDGSNAKNSPWVHGLVSPPHGQRAFIGDYQPNVRGERQEAAVAMFRLCGADVASMTWGRRDDSAQRFTIRDPAGIFAIPAAKACNGWIRRPRAIASRSAALVRGIASEAAVNPPPCQSDRKDQSAAIA